MAAKVNADGIHVFVDLNGYTAGGKTEVYILFRVRLRCAA
jgi:predicted O-linked N-acetylglucosamine transferase (SPINDLY family)